MSTVDQLQFYVTDPEHFQLRLTVDGVHNVSCLAYMHGDRFKSRRSRLGVGMSTGDVIVLELLPFTKTNSPFYRDGLHMDQPPPVYNIIEMTDARAGHAGFEKDRPFRAIWSVGLHPANVYAIAFCSDVAGWWLASVSHSLTRSVSYCHLDRHDHRNDKRLAVRHGASSFGARCVCAAGDGRLATGDHAGWVTLWDVDKVHRLSAVAKLHGHDEAVCHLFYDPKVSRLFSVSAGREVVLWDVATTDKLITLHVSAALADDPKPQWPIKCLAAHFDQDTVVLAVAVGRTLVAYKCSEYYGRLVAERSDTGHSHGAPVVKTMYNSLLNVLVSVSAADSTIVVWNPCTGQPIARRPMAHQREFYGKKIQVEITAATFDPSLGQLATGAADGTIKIWNPSKLTMLKRYQTPTHGRISGMIWTSNGVLFFYYLQEVIIRVRNYMY